MTKFKIGDGVYYWTTHKPVKEKTFGVVNKIDGDKIFAWGPYGWMPKNKVFLKEPTTFEVGKKYHVKKTVTGILDDKIFEVLFITDTNHIVVRWDHDRKEVIWRPEATGRWGIEEYTPPPPEEWRAVYWRLHSKPEISSATWESKEAVENDEKSHTHFMYAIRTDEGVMNK